MAAGGGGARRAGRRRGGGGAEPAAAPEGGAAEEGLALRVHLTPGARSESVGGVRDGALRVAVTAPPVDGRANRACERALASAFGLRPGRVALRAGARGRRKRFQLRGPREALERRLEELAREETP